MRLYRNLAVCAVSGGLAGLCVTAIIAVLKLAKVLELARPIIRGMLGLG